MKYLKKAIRRKFKKFCVVKVFTYLAYSFSIFGLFFYAYNIVVKFLIQPNVDVRETLTQSSEVPIPAMLLLFALRLCLEVNL